MRRELLKRAIDASILAGKKIVEVKNSMSIGVEYKDDNSPVTVADRAASRVIIDELESTAIDIISEEEEIPSYEIRKEWKQFWIIDPLDGTKEFIKNRKEYTVNVALVEGRAPTIGVIYIPETDLLYYGDVQTGSFMVEEVSKYGLDEILSRGVSLPSSKLEGTFKILCSNSHMNSDTKEYIDDIKLKRGAENVEVKPRGSSLKMCLVAEGKADLFPRLGNVMEWDTAAGEAICIAAGCSVTSFDGSRVEYNKTTLLQPWMLIKRER